MGTDAVIFDLDGTLVDTLDDIADAMDRVLASEGLPIPPRDRYREYIGEGVSKLTERAVPPKHHDRLDDIAAAFRADYADNLIVKSRLYDGIAAALDAIVASGRPIAILSNKPDPMTQRIAETMLARWPFAVVMGQQPGVPRKPDPRVALAITEALGVSNADCAFVGDTRTDMDTATAAAMLPVGVLWGFRDRAELEAHGARVIVEHPSELADAL